MIGNIILFNITGDLMIVGLTLLLADILIGIDDWAKIACFVAMAIGFGGLLDVIYKIIEVAYGG